MIGNNNIKLTAEQRRIVKPIVKAAFPNYTGRKISVQLETKPMSLYSTWDEGSKDWYVAVELSTLKVIPIPTNGGIMERAEIKGVEIPPGVAIVRRSMFLGSPYTVTIHIGARDANKIHKGFARDPKLLAIGSDDVVVVVVDANLT